MSLVIIALSALFFLGHILKWVFIKTKVPDLLVLVVLGYLFGPIMGWITVSDFGKVGGVISTLALIVILYEGGLHLSARDLLTSMLPASGLAVAGFFLMATFATVAAVTIGFQSWPLAVLLGLALGSTSSAIVIPMVKHLSITEKTKTVLSLESAFTDVLAIVLFLVVADGLVGGHFSMKDIFVGIGPKTMLSILYGCLFGIFWAFVKKRWSSMVEIHFANEASALLVYGLIEWTGHNGAMAVLALGFTLANLDLVPEWMKPYLSNKPVSSEALSLLNELTFLLKTFFFIYLGVLVQFSDWKKVLFAAFLCFGIFLTRFLVVRFLFRIKDRPTLDAMITVAMGPRGLACAVLATIPVQRNIEGGIWIQETLFALIPMSIFLTAFFVVLSETKWMRPKLEPLFGNKRGVG